MKGIGCGLLIAGLLLAINVHPTAGVSGLLLAATLMLFGVVLLLLSKLKS
jgi:hypothetical protein